VGIRPVSLPSEGNQLSARRRDTFLDKKNGARKTFGEIQGDEISAAKCQMGCHDPKDNRKPASCQIVKTDMHGATVSAQPAQQFSKCARQRHISSARDLSHGHAASRSGDAPFLQFLGSVGSLVKTDWRHS